MYKAGPTLHTILAYLLYDNTFIIYYSIIIINIIIIIILLFLFYYLNKHIGKKQGTSAKRLLHQTCNFQNENRLAVLQRIPNWRRQCMGGPCQYVTVYQCVNSPSSATR
jgi:predicted membrane protein